MPVGHIARMPARINWHCLSLLLLVAPMHAQSREVCASNLAQLREMTGNSSGPLAWSETTMKDGRPLVVTLHENGDALELTFTKTGAGLWAAGTGAICRVGTSLVARFGEGQLRTGPAAPWLLRQLLKSGGEFTLSVVEPGQLRIATRGWSGDFVPLLSREAAALPAQR